MRGKSGSVRVSEGLGCGGYDGGYDSLFHLGCLWTLVLIGVGGGVAMYRGFIFILLVLCSNSDLRFGMFSVVFLWCIHSICTASVSICLILRVWLVLSILWCRVGSV
jgi:hypothetical protein